MSLINSNLPKPRPLPVIILADVSGSMAGEKIATLNAALRDMVSTFQNLDTSIELQMALITFGEQVNLVQTLLPVRDIVLPELTAIGKTPMGGAFKLLTELIGDKNLIPSRGLTPSIILVSDGLPNDIPETNQLYRKLAEGTAKKEDFLQWEPLQAFHDSERGKKCGKLALGIGDDADYEMLKAFVNNPEIPVIKANDARGINKFLQWATMSISMRSVSRDPNLLQIASTDKFTDDELVI